MTNSSLTRWCGQGASGSYCYVGALDLPFPTIHTVLFAGTSGWTRCDARDLSADLEAHR